jgi:hypothetical protein
MIKGIIRVKAIGLKEIRLINPVNARTKNITIFVKVNGEVTGVSLVLSSIPPPFTPRK